MNWRALSVIPNRLFLWVGLPLLLLAFFDAWKVQKDAAETAQNEIKWLSHPIFELEIRQVTGLAGESFPEDKRGILLLAEISNRGAPSTCINWKLQINTIDSRILNPQKTFMGTEGFGASTIRGGPKMIFPRTSLMVERTATEPVGRNAREVGALLFVIDANYSDLISELGTNYTLSCKDIEGNSVSATLEIDRATPDPFNLVPGLEYEIIEETN